MMLRSTLLTGLLPAVLVAFACNGNGPPAASHAAEATGALVDANAGVEPSSDMLPAPAEGRVGAGADSAGSIDLAKLDAESPDVGEDHSEPAADDDWPRFPGAADLADACMFTLEELCDGDDCPDFNETLESARASHHADGTRSHCEGEDGSRYITLSVTGMIYVFDAPSEALVAAIRFSDGDGFCLDTTTSIALYGSPPESCAWVNFNEATTVCSDTSSADRRATETCRYEFTP